MHTIDYKALGQKIIDAGLVGKPVNEYNKDEVDLLVSACVYSLIPCQEGPFTSKPSIEDGELRIPFNSDPRYFWWMKCGQPVSATLRELQASDEVWRKYVKEE